MLRITALILSALLPLPALALCNGAGFVDDLSPADQAELRAMADATPFGEGLYWQATRDGANVTILGTMHLPDPRHDAIVAMARPRLEAAEMSGDAGLDVMLMDVAAAQNIPVAPLEPWQDMFALISGGTTAEQIEVLEMSLLSPALQDAMVTELTNRYFSGETAIGWHMARFAVPLMPNMTLAQFDASMEEFEEALLWGRNRAWIPVIETAATTHDRVFIGFGAAHLIGEEGVLNLLAQNGWTISPL